MKNLGEYIKEKRIELGWTTNMLHTKSGLSRTEILRIEDGTRKQPSIQNLRRLATVLNIEYSTLLRLAGYERMSDESSLQFEYPVLKNQNAFEFFQKMLNLMADHPETSVEKLTEIYRYAEYRLSID